MNPPRPTPDQHGLDVAVVRLEGALNTAVEKLTGEIHALGAKVDGQVAELRSTVGANAKEAAQVAEFLKSEVERAHQRVDAVEERARANTRLIITAFISPVVVAVLVAVVLIQLHLKH